MQWTLDQIKALAPDAGSLKAGQGLAHARHWSALGRSDQAIWGDCKGSASMPYAVQIDESEPAFKCSCPSRKFPCKHAIGLMMMHVANSVKPAAKPQWVDEWLTDRATRA